MAVADPVLDYLGERGKVQKGYKIG